MSEDVAQAWGVTELWKKRAKECEKQAQDELKGRLQETKFTLDRKIWNVGKTSTCFHQPGCGHLANSAGVRTLKPCAHCVPDAMGAVLGLTQIPTD